MPWFDAYASTHVWPNHVEQLTTRLVIWSANTYCGTHCAALEARQPWFLSICDRSQSVVDLLQSSKSNWMFFLKRNVSVFLLNKLNEIILNMIWRASSVPNSQHEFWRLSFMALNLVRQAKRTKWDQVCAKMDSPKTWCWPPGRKY